MRRHWPRRVSEVERTGSFLLTEAETDKVCTRGGTGQEECRKLREQEVFFWRRQRRINCVQEMALEKKRVSEVEDKEEKL